MTPETTRRSSRRDAAIGVLLFAALVVLAVLQYRWIGQVSEADRERLRRGLDSSVARFSDDFNTEIERLMQVLQAGPAPVNNQAALTERLDRWRDVAPHARIVKRVSLDSASELPEPIAGILARRAGRGGGPGDGGPGGRGGPLVIAESSPIVAIPNRPAQPGDPQQWFVVEFDGDYIRDTWLPELVERDLGSEYHVRVFGPHGVIYQTPGTPAGPLMEEGNRAPLFMLRLGGPGRGRGGRPGEFKDKDKEFKDKNKRPPFDGPPENGKGPGGRGGDAAWHVEAAYRLGGMTEQVAALRARNLAVSFGILLLMGISVSMLMWSTRRANALARQQMEFVAGVTHELRTPLAVILSASQNLADGVASGAAQTQRYGGVIHAHTKRLSNMVEQVLRFAGLSSQHGDLQRAPVSMNEVVAEAVADSEADLSFAGCTLKQDVAPSLPAVDGDRAALLHALRNLLGNAAKHAPGTAVTLRARTDGADTMEIAVEDGGPGIAPADLPHLFEPFYRGSRAKYDQVQGSGLGLSLVKKIAEAHGGRAEAGNRQEGGATVRMLLPVKKT